MARAEAGPSGLTDHDQFRARRADLRSIPIAIAGERVEPRIHEMPGEPGLVDEAQSIDADGHIIRTEAEMRLIGDEFFSGEANVIVDLDARAVRQSDGFARQSRYPGLPFARQRIAGLESQFSAGSQMTGE